MIEDAHAFKDKHEAMAARIRSERVERDSARVFGTLFDVEGNVASPMVFYLTDSTTRFLYGSLYFDARPNADSLEPVTGRIREDLRHFANTLSWRWLRPVRCIAFNSAANSSTAELVQYAQHDGHLIDERNDAERELEMTDSNNQRSAPCKAVFRRSR